MNYQQALEYLLQELELIPNKQQEIYWILEYLAHKSKQEILSNLNLLLTEDQKKSLKEITGLRKKNYPLQYLLKDFNFFNLNFTVCTDVLIPREDTSVLVEYIIQYAPKNIKMLEIGVGSGIISLTIKKYRPDIDILATDINPKALKCTLHNEKNIFGQNGFIRLEQKDLFTNIQEKFDIIVSNPPYITQEELASSDPELLFEPYNALVAKDKGLYFYKEILEQGVKYLNPNGFFVLEISSLRLEGILEFIHSKHKKYKIRNDLSDQPRAMIIQN